MTLPDAVPTDPAAGFLEQALALARQSIGVSEPNPRVGCVLTDRHGRVMGRGHTQAAGGPHAEVMALRDAAAAGHDARGATAWVTLEPCSHHGRTGPCCDALLQAGVSQVVAASADPNPLVAGRGIDRLRAGGVEVVVEDGPVAAAARALNIGFFSRMRRQRPWLRMKIAASLDGTTALADGSSQWITGAAARADGHAWRARAGALLTGIGTVLEDDPLLNVRLPDADADAAPPPQPPLVLVDSRLQTPPDARLWSVAQRPVWLYAAEPDAHRSARLAECGASITLLPDRNGKVDLAALVADLARREVNELHVEAGHKLNGSLLHAGLVDELLVYLAPKLLGPARGMTGLAPLAALSGAIALDFRASCMIGADLRITAVVAGRDRF